MRFQWRRMCPYLRVHIFRENRVSVFRWFGWSWTAVSCSQFLYVQYGRKCPRFVAKIRRGQIPTFLLSADYRTVFRSRGLRAGYVLRPVNIKGVWRQLNGVHEVRARAGVVKEQG